MKVSDIFFMIVIGAILLHLFSIIQIPVIIEKDKTDVRYNELLRINDSISNSYDSLNNKYQTQNNKYDSIITYYSNQYDSAKQSNSEIIRNYEEKLKDINDVTVVDNDSITEYISKRIHNR